MATTKDYKEYILDELNTLNDITSRPMMGEYLLYYKGVLFGGIYDNRFLIKITNNNKKYHLEESIPYKNAKPMYLIDSEDRELIKNIIIDSYNDLNKGEKNEKKSIS